ncbi:lactoylglutathione lyase, partial [Xanthomonas perforans]
MPLNDLQHAPGANAAPADPHGSVFTHTIPRVNDATPSL